MRCVHLGKFAPRSEIGRSNVLPVLAGIVGDLDQAIVGSGPDEVDVFGRWCDGVDDAAMLAFGGIVGDEGPRVAGTPGSSRVKSGLMICQLSPPSVVLKRTFDPR